MSGTCLPLSLHPALKLGLRTQYYPGQTGVILSTPSSILCPAVCPCPAYEQVEPQPGREQSISKELDSTEASLHLSPRKLLSIFPHHCSQVLITRQMHSSRPTLSAQPLLQSPKYKAEHTSKSNSFILIVQNAKKRSKLPMVTSRSRTGEEERKKRQDKQTSFLPARVRELPVSSREPVLPVH